MFFAQAATTTLTNQTVAVGVLAMILAGIAWIVRQLFSMLPNLMDRLDKQEEKRATALRDMAAGIRESSGNLAVRMEHSNKELAGRIENSNRQLGERFRECLRDVRQSVDESNQITAMFLASMEDDPVEPHKRFTIKIPGKAEEDEL